MRQCLEYLSLHKADIIHELVAIYTTIGNGEKTEEGIARCKTNIDEILRRKDKLLDLSIDGRISDDEFSLRNNRFNAEIEKLNNRLHELEEEKIKNKDMMQSIEVLRKAIESELNFSNGFSVGVVDALLDHVDIFETDDKNQIKVQVYLKAIGEKQEYLVQRFPPENF